MSFAPPDRDPRQAPHQQAVLQRPVLQRQCACGGTCPACRRKKQLQREAATSRDRGNAGPDLAPPSVHQELGRSGQPLDDATRTAMEGRFRHDFRNVRVHADHRAGDSADAVEAHAYTVGRHIVFGRGRYTPASAEGRKLLAHELTHVVQQGGGEAPSGQLPIAGDSNTEERQAQRNGELAGPVAAVAGGPRLQRKKRRGKKKPRTYGVRFSPRSQISAAQMLEIIQRSPTLETWMRDSFAVDGNRLVLAGARIRKVTGKKPSLDVPQGVDVPPWFANVLFAMTANGWYVTTAATLLSQDNQLGMKADLEPESRHVKGMPPREEGISMGYTFQGASRKQGRRKKGERQPGSSVEAAPRRPDEGLIVVSNRLQQDPDSPAIVLRAEERVLETLFHELAAHGELIRQGQDAASDHTSPDWRIGLEPMSEADKIAKQVYDYFGGQREQREEQKRMECAVTAANTSMAPIAPVTDLEGAADLSQRMEQLGRFIDVCGDLVSSQQVRRKQGGTP